MLRQISFVLPLSILLLSAGVAEANQQKPVKQPPKQCDQSVCVQHKVDAQGKRTSTTVTPKPGSTFNGGKPQTFTKSLLKLSYSVPQTDPSQPKPINPRHADNGRVVKSEKDCKGVALVDPDTNQIICYDTQAFSGVSYAISFEDNCPIVARSKDRVFRMCHPVEDPSVPIEKQDPSTIYPGLPPVPPKLSSVCNPMKPCPVPQPKKGFEMSANVDTFVPHTDSRTPRMTYSGATRKRWTPPKRYGSAKDTWGAGGRAY